MSDVIWKKFCKAKVSDFRIEISIKENIASFDISMDYWRFSFLVKEAEATSDTQTDCNSSRPIKFDMITFRSLKK